MSEDEFDGYLDDDNLTTGGDESLSPTKDAASSSSQADDDAGSQPIPDFQQPVGCAGDMTGASPLQLFAATAGYGRDVGDDCGADQPLRPTVHGEHQSSPTLQSTWMEQIHF